MKSRGGGGFWDQVKFREHITAVFARRRAAATLACSRSRRSGTCLWYVLTARDADVVSHQHRVGHDIEGRPVRGRLGLAVLRYSKNQPARLRTGKLLGSPLATSAETGLSRIEGPEGDRAELEVALLQFDDAGEHRLLGTAEGHQPVRLNVDRRLGIGLEGALHVVRKGRSRLGLSCRPPEPGTGLRQFGPQDGCPAQRSTPPARKVARAPPLPDRPLPS